MAASGREVELGRVLSLVVARRRASENGWRERTLAYVTREPSDLLILEHTDEAGDAGVQVPGGGIEPGETPTEAVLRELMEEAGLRGSDPVYLESREWPLDAPSRIRHYFWIEAPSGAADAWEHRVVSGDEDDGSLYRLRFVDVGSHGLSIGYGFESGLETLRRVMGERRAGR